MHDSDRCYLLSLTISRVLRYFPIVLITVAGPCETCQLILNSLGRWRSLLLRLEWQRRPQLSEELALLHRSATQDLGELGDLGLFRLRRSTLLSILSTVITYIIVMAQFQMSENNPSDKSLRSAVNGSQAT